MGGINSTVTPGQIFEADSSNDINGILQNETLLKELLESKPVVNCLLKNKTILESILSKNLVLSLKYTCILTQDASNIDEIREIIRIAEGCNLENGISGELNVDYSKELYICEQTIESTDHAAIERLFENIQKDSRIQEFITVQRWFQTSRSHEDWSMMLTKSICLSGRQRKWSKDFGMDSRFLEKKSMFQFNDGKGVWRVEDSLTQKNYVLKTCTSHQYDVTEYTFLKHIADEAASRSMSYPNLVSCPDIWFEQGIVNLLYTFYPTDLWNFIRHCGEVSENVQRIFIVEMLQMAFALKDIKIIHRDIKLENILVDRNGRLVLTDFEFAIFNEEERGKKRMMKKFVGSPEYFSPSLISRGVYGYDTDLWAIGMVIYEIVSPQLPWPSLTTRNLTLMYKEMTTTDIRRPTSVQDDNLWSVLRTMLNSSPDSILSVEKIAEMKYFGNVDLTCPDYIDRTEVSAMLQSITPTESDQIPNVHHKNGMVYKDRENYWSTQPL